MDPLLASYEAVPYDSKPIALADVSVLETMALLYGLRAPPGDECRVLELGCGSGAHLAAMAYQSPSSRFVGVDLAPNQIAKGRETVAALSLANVTLECMSLTAIDDDFGVFDYIICHGVYSWVPPEVQEAILRICSRNLAANGVAYVSYNTYPGWHARGLVREMILLHDIPSLTPGERVARARAYVDSVVANQVNATSAYAMALADEQRHLSAQSDGYFFHEQMEPFNTPMYFTEFARRASVVGLRHLTDAKLWSAGGSDGADMVRAEQHSDFLRGAMFRRSLLCHDAVQVTTLPSAAAVAELHLTIRAAHVEPAAADAARGPDVQSFRSPDGVIITTNDPLVVAALTILLRVAPATLAFDELLRRVDARLDAESTPGLAQETPNRARELADAMLQCATARLIELHPRSSRIVARASDRPLASTLARHQGRHSQLVPNLRHNLIELSEFERLVLVELDGSRTRSDVFAVVEEALSRTEFPSEIYADNTALATMVDAAIDRFARAALLER